MLKRTLSGKMNESEDESGKNAKMDAKCGVNLKVKHELKLKLNEC